jgi:hypothetical protein
VILAILTGPDERSRRFASIRAAGDRFMMGGWCVMMIHVVGDGGFVGDGVSVGDGGSVGDGCSENKFPRDLRDPISFDAG